MKRITRKSLTAIVGPGNIAFVRGEKVLGTARKVNGGWALRIPGHQWEVTADMPTNRFNAIPGRKIARTPVKGFKSWQACANEVERLTKRKE